MSAVFACQYFKKYIKEFLFLFYEKQNVHPPSCRTFCFLVIMRIKG